MSTAQVSNTVYPWHNNALEAEQFVELLRLGFPDATQMSISRSLLQTLTEEYGMPKSEALFWQNRLLRNIYTLMRRGYSLEPYYTHAGNLVLVGVDGLSITSRQRLMSRLHELGNFETRFIAPGPIPLSRSKTKEYLRLAHIGHVFPAVDEPVVQHGTETRSRKRGRGQLRAHTEGPVTNEPHVHFSDDYVMEYYTRECQSFLTLKRMGYHDVTVESIKDGLLHTLIVKYHMPDSEAKEWQRELSKHITHLVRKQKALDLYAKHNGDLVLVAMEDMALNRRTRLNERIQHWSRQGSNVSIANGPIPLSLAKTKRYLTIHGWMNQRNDSSHTRPNAFLSSRLQSRYQTLPQHPQHTLAFAQHGVTRERSQHAVTHQQPQYAVTQQQPQCTVTQQQSQYAVTQQQPQYAVTQQQPQCAMTQQQPQHQARVQFQERSEMSVQPHSVAQVQSRSDARHSIPTAASIALPVREVQTAMHRHVQSPQQADIRPHSGYAAVVNEAEDVLSTRGLLRTLSPTRITPPGSPAHLWLRLPDTPLLENEFDNWMLD